MVTWDRYEYSERIGAMYEGSNPLVQTFGYTVGGAHPSLRKGKLDHFVYGPETIPQRVGREVGETLYYECST